MEFVTDPHVETRPEVPTLGIRTITPYRGMLATRDRLLAELIRWLDDHGVEAGGHFFLRLYDVDMSGPMDIEVGVTDSAHVGDERVRPGVLLAGRYATLAYRAVSMPANIALFTWIGEQHLTLDRAVVPEGERYGCRTEMYLTDPRTEKRKKQWVVELAFRLAD